MEASDTSADQAQDAGEPNATGQDQSEQPVQDSGQPSADSQSESPAPAQEQPTQDSGLQTPQPDQPVPTEPERQQQAPDAEQAAAPTQTQPGYAPSSAQQSQDAVARENELAEARRQHNSRTGGGEIQDNEVQDARQEHNDRTGGGEVPGTSSEQ